MGRKSDPDRFSVTKDGLFPGILFALFVRLCVAAYPYSGYKSPPMYGDFEAQRHWQEITVHTPALFWYHNTTQNDLQYWGLDYPPLTAYHSYLMGLVADWIDPESVRLFASRGYEDQVHKLFMRLTVFISDIYFYVSAVLCICIDMERVKPKLVKNVFKRCDIGVILLLLYPGLILIDHGHFQYNCVSLGLFMWATFFIIAIENHMLATTCFVLALNYKQMELYHSLPFFIYLLRSCFNDVHQKWKLYTFINQFNKLTVVVVSCFIIIWFPLVSSWKDINQIIFRLFPLKRGVFEDKVSNVWCFANVFIKLKEIYTNEQMAKICLSATALAGSLSCIDLFFRCNKQKFVLSLINVSLAFFLFSFQVHEKTILLVAIPVALHLPDDPFMCFWFLLVSNFSMLPLLIRDGLIVPFVATTLIYMVFFSISIKIANPSSGIFAMFSAFKVYSSVKPNKLKNSMFLNLLSLNFLFSCLGMVGLTLGAMFIKPLPKFPDLWPLLISVYSCSHFILFFLYFNYQQLLIPKAPQAKPKLN